jgi:WXG100 family type VII secretion target
MLKVSPEEMLGAAGRCDRLAEQIQECYAEMNRINVDLQGMYEGESARAFDSFVTSTAAPSLRSVSGMCEDTARGLRHTVEQFQQADSGLSGVFS